MKKSHDWQLKMQAFAQEKAALPFAWGTNDCAVFAADFLHAVTGENPAQALRTHSNAKQAARVAKDNGGLSGLAAGVLGESIPAAFASVGDIVLINMDGREALAVCNGSTAMGPGPLGLVHVPMAGALKCWRVD